MVARPGEFLGVSACAFVRVPFNIKEVFMPAIANVLVTKQDASVLPTVSATIGVDTTYAPERFLPGGVARWVDRSGGIALGYPSLSFSIRPPTKDSRVFKISTKLFNPVLETIDPAVGIFGPKLAYVAQAHLDFLIPERMTANERLYFLRQLRSLFMATITASDASPSDATGSPLVAAITNLEDVY